MSEVLYVREDGKQEILCFQDQNFESFVSFVLVYLQISLVFRFLYRGFVCYCFFIPESFEKVGEGC